MKGARYSLLSTGFDVFISCFRLISFKIIVHYPYSFDMSFLDTFFLHIKFRSFVFVQSSSISSLSVSSKQIGEVLPLVPASGDGSGIVTNNINCWMTIRDILSSAPHSIVSPTLLRPPHSPPSGRHSPLMSYWMAPIRPLKPLWHVCVCGEMRRIIH